MTADPDPQQSTAPTVETADALLRPVRLGNAFEDTVGRLRGDAFAIILTGVTGPHAARSAVDRALACFDEPFRLEGELVRVETSVGIAVHTGPGGTVKELLREADTRMYRHKQRRSGSAG